MNAFTTPAVNPGGSDSANLVISPLNGFTGSVSLSCQVSPAPPNGNAGCTVSPQTVTPPTGASVTVVTTYTSGNTTANWPANTYSVTITGTAGSETETASQRFAVLQVPLSFNISIQTPVSPSSVPAGGSSEGVININPVNGYAGQVTLSCSTVTPLNVSPPVCAFNPPTVAINDTVASSTLTISTTGPLNIAGKESHRRLLYAIWLPLPMLGLVGVGTMFARKRRAGLSTLLVLMFLATFLLLVPACSNYTQTVATQNRNVTPNGTYTFTITGVDQNGTGATTGSSDTVTLTVTTAIT